MKRVWKGVLGVVLVAALAGCAGGSSPDEAVGTPAGAGTLSLKPDEACGLLADKGLRTVGGYQATVQGVYLCSSFEKVIPAGEPVFDTLKYFAQGTAEAVNQLSVQLLLKSPGDAQVAFRYLLQSVEALTQRALGAPVPDAAQVAIRSGVTGSWPVAGATLTVERISAFTTTLVVTLR